MMYVPLLFWTVLLMVSLVLVVTDDFVCLSVCPCVCPSVCLSVCLTFYLSICLCVFLSVFSFCFVFLPFVLTDVFELREDKHVQSYSNRKEVTEYIHHLFTNIETSSKHCTVIDININNTQSSSYRISDRLRESINFDKSKHPDVSPYKRLAVLEENKKFSVMVFVSALLSM